MIKPALQAAGVDKDWFKEEYLRKIMQRSNMDSRICQFKQGIERIVDKYERKAHIIGYSFTGVLPRVYISLHNGCSFPVDATFFNLN